MLAGFQIALKNIKFDSNLVTSRLQSTAVRVQERKTFESRLHYAKKLEIEFRSKAKIHRDEVVLALLVNAWHESRWNPKTNSDGILQLTRSGMGKGMSAIERQDISKTVDRFVSTKVFQNWLKLARSTDDVGKMSYEFADDVLRPKKQHRPPRRTTALNWINHLEEKPFKT